MNVNILEVGPRDGLQNERLQVPTSSKLEFIKFLADAGLGSIEATSFVSSKWVPQLGDAEELWPQLGEINAVFSALVPNKRGLDRALEVGVSRIALFTAASDAFTQRNINMTVAESLAAFQEVVDEFRAKEPRGWIRGYVSTAFECPYAGKIDPRATISVAEQLLKMGVDEVSLGDTIGVAVPAEVRSLTNDLIKSVDVKVVNYHFHDTRGTAIANVAEALSLGVRSFDSSAGGLGGCPYAPGAGGNLATEDLVYFLERTGIPTGVDLEKLARASLKVFEIIGRQPTAKAQLATLAVRP